MKNWWSLLTITYGMFVLQTTLAGALEIRGVRPDFVVLGLLLIVPQLSGWRIVGLAALWGLLADGLSHAGMGVNVVCFSVAAFAYWHLQWQVAARSPLGRCLLQFPIAFVLLTVSTLLRETLTGRVPNIPALLSEAALTSAYIVSLGILIVVLVAVVRWRLTRSEHAAPAVRNRWRMLTES